MFSRKKKRDPNIRSDKSSVVGVGPYQSLAAIYDFVMRHVDYVEWADYIEDLFLEFNADPQCVYEVACGTGTLAKRLALRGFTVHGVDASPEMIQIAKSKVDGDRNNLTFGVADMRHLEPDEADAVLCMYDSVNYCLTEDDLGATMGSLRRVVRPGALGVFDITTESNSLLYFRDYEIEERHGNYRYHRRSEYIAKQHLQVNEFRIENANTGETVTERHEQRIYPIETVLRAIDRSDWEIIGTFDDYTFDPADDKSERIHVAMKAL